MNLTAVNLSQGASTTVNAIVYENFSASNVTLKQGEYTAFTYTVDVTDSLQRYIIPSNNIDTSTISVTGLKSGELTVNAYTLITNIDQQDIDGTTYAFFLFENSDGDFEIRFVIFMNIK